MAQVAVDTNEVHKREHRAVLDSKTIERILVEAVVATVPQPDRPLKFGPGVAYKVEFQDQTEGSPPYRVGVKAIVKIVEDLLPQPAVAEDRRGVSEDA